MQLRSAEEKLILIIKVFAFSFLSFVSIYLPFIPLLHPFYRLIYLAGVIPVTMSIGSAFLCKIRVGPIFLFYVTAFSSLHFLMFRGLLAYSEIVWILAWVILPSFSTWGIVMNTWTGHPAQASAKPRKKKTVQQPALYVIENTNYSPQDYYYQEEIYESFEEAQAEVDYLAYEEHIN